MEKLVIRAKICREPHRASMMIDRPGSVRTIVAADRAASHASETATPTLAPARAGASWTPSADIRELELDTGTS